MNPSSFAKEQNLPPSKGKTRIGSWFYVEDGFYSRWLFKQRFVLPVNMCMTFRHVHTPVNEVWNPNLPTLTTYPPILLGVKVT